MSNYKFHISRTTKITIGINLEWGHTIRRNRLIRNVNVLPNHRGGADNHGTLWYHCSGIKWLGAVYKVYWNTVILKAKKKKTPQK